VDIKKQGEEETAVLKGICYRIQADAPKSDLVVQSNDHVSEHYSRMKRTIEKKHREMSSASVRSNQNRMSFRGFRDTPKEENQKYNRSGKVLHIDGDEDYLNTCLEEYKRLGIEAFGKYASERNQPNEVYKLLRDNRPDILVLTGHDSVIKGDNSYLNLSNYSNSKHFIEAVKEARRYEPDLDSLVIFAGACQSMYKEIIAAGANFASSPYRVLIHAFDPVFVCQKIAFTSFNKTLDPLEVINNTITGMKGIGGIETRGKYRIGYPAEPQNNYFIQQN
jgi:spore coat assembly protein